MAEPVVPQPSPSALRRSILVHLRRTGPASPDVIATAIGASRSGVAQQLRALDSAGLVSRTAVRHGVGRPRHLYDITEDAQGLFPSNYEGLASGLLAAIMEVGGDSLLEDVFAARRRQAGATLRARLEAALPPDAPLAERVRELARIQDELGYIAEARVDGDRVRLLEHNCAVLDIARDNPGACRAELALFRDVLGTEVVRERHIASGDRRCEYRVGPASAPDAAVAR
jgi:predicted ArsR family transcriptional regulator